jgi:hypothetical protein
MWGLGVVYLPNPNSLCKPECWAGCTQAVGSPPAQSFLPQGTLLVSSPLDSPLAPNVPPQGIPLQSVPVVTPPDQIVLPQPGPIQVFPSDGAQVQGNPGTEPRVEERMLPPQDESDERWHGCKLVLLETGNVQYYCFANIKNAVKLTEGRRQRDELKRCCGARPPTPEEADLLILHGATRNANTSLIPALHVKEFYKGKVSLEVFKEMARGIRDPSLVSPWSCGTCATCACAFLCSHFCVTYHVEEAVSGGARYVTQDGGEEWVARCVAAALDMCGWLGKEGGAIVNSSKPNE